MRGLSCDYPLATTASKAAHAHLTSTPALAEQDIAQLDQYIDALTLIADKRISEDGGSAGATLLKALNI